MLQHTPVNVPSGASHTNYERIVDVTPNPTANRAISHFLGARLTEKRTGESRTITGVRYSESNPAYVGFELDNFEQAVYSFGVLMRDYIAEEGRSSEMQTQDFYSCDDVVRVVTLYEGGNITLPRHSFKDGNISHPRQFPRIANAA